MIVFCIRPIVFVGVFFFSLFKSFFVSFNLKYILVREFSVGLLVFLLVSRERYERGSPPDFNRFRELDFSAGRIRSGKNKRPRAEDFIPLPETSSNQQNLPRYLVASAIP